VILVVGDGMNYATEVAGSRYLYGTDEGLSFQGFPGKAFTTTWDVGVYAAHADALGLPHYEPQRFDPTLGYDPALGGAVPYPLTPDSQRLRDYFIPGGNPGPAPYSASTGTAMSTGHKTDPENIAWAAGDPADGALRTTPQLLREQYGMAVGFVTTGPFSHATPAAWFAHNVSRYNYFEIAHELLTSSRPEVMIGGGALSVGTYVTAEELADMRRDSEYVTVERVEGVDGEVSLADAAARAVGERRKLFGLYGGVDGNFESFVPVNAPGAPAATRGNAANPSLASAVVSALDVLAEDPDGFFLLVEQADIDWANHSNDYARMIGCVADLEAAIKAIDAYVDRPGDELTWDNTTLLVTADHANGYLRFGKTLGKGELPRQEVVDGHYSYPDGEISYAIGTHTNELVAVQLRGRMTGRLPAFQDVYPGLTLMDDTAIFKLTLEAAAR